MNKDKKASSPCDCKEITITINGKICGNIDLIDHPNFIHDYIHDKIDELEKVLSKNYKIPSNSPFLYNKPKARFLIDIDEGDGGVDDDIR